MMNVLSNLSIIFKDIERVSGYIKDFPALQHGDSSRHVVGSHCPGLSALFWLPYVSQTMAGLLSVGRK